MSLTELQRPTKLNFYDRLQKVAYQMEDLINRWDMVSEFIGFIESSDLDAMGVPTGQIRTDLANLRTAMNEFIAYYRGESTTQTVVPGIAVDKIRNMG